MNSLGPPGPDLKLTVPQASTIEEKMLALEQIQRGISGPADTVRRR